MSQTATFDEVLFANYALARQHAEHLEDLIHRVNTRPTLSSCPETVVLMRLRLKEAEDLRDELKQQYDDF